MEGATGVSSWGSTKASGRLIRPPVPFVLLDWVSRLRPIFDGHQKKVPVPIFRPSLTVIDSAISQEYFLSFLPESIFIFE